MRKTVFPENQKAVSEHQKAVLHRSLKSRVGNYATVRTLPVCG